MLMWIRRVLVALPGMLGCRKMLPFSLLLPDPLGMRRTLL